MEIKEIDAKKLGKGIFNLCILSLILLLLYAMGQWLIPFIVSLILAYAFHVPLQNVSKKLRISESFSAGIIVVLIISIVALFTIFLVPLFKKTALILIERIPSLLSSTPEIINNSLHELALKFGIERTFDIGSSLNDYVSGLTENWPKHLYSFINTGFTLIYIVMFAFMTPIITFYLLRDWSRIETSFNKILTKVASPAVISIIETINIRLGAYIRGQLKVCSLLAILYITCLFFLGVNKFFVCGLFSGILSIAPFFGPFVGLLSTLSMSIYSSDFIYSEAYRYLLIGIPYVIIPFIDSNFITPKFIGKSTGIQPVWLLFSICATVSILGTVGIFISIPMAVILSTICKELIKKL